MPFSRREARMTWYLETKSYKGWLRKLEQFTWEKGKSSHSQIFEYVDFGREVIFLCFACFSLPLKNYFYLSCILGDKESACNAEDAAGAKGLISGSGRSPGEGNGNPLQYPCLGKSHGQRSLGGYSPWGCKRVGHYLATQQQSYMQLFEESNSSASLRSLTTFFISIPENLHISFF